jgi:antitoxin (DNA-binding transcriptional repressor) of toxin-antitoxin stability system
VNVHEAKTTLSKLLDEIERGGHISIARNGKPVAELRAIRKPTMFQAVAAFRSANHIRLAGLTIRDLIDDGRR